MTQHINDEKLRDDVRAAFQECELLPTMRQRLETALSPILGAYGLDCHKAGYERGHRDGVDDERGHQALADEAFQPADLDALRPALLQKLAGSLASSVNGMHERIVIDLSPIISGYGARCYRAGEAAGLREDRLDRAVADQPVAPEPVPAQVGQVVTDRERFLDAGLRALAARATLAEDWSTAADLYAVLSTDRHIPDLVDDEPYVPEWDDLPQGDLD